MLRKLDIPSRFPVPGLKVLCRWLTSWSTFSDNNFGFWSLLLSYNYVIYSTHLSAIFSWSKSIVPFLSFMQPFAFFLVCLYVSSFTLLCISLYFCSFSSLSTSSRWSFSHFSLAFLQYIFICLSIALYFSSSLFFYFVPSSIIFKISSFIHFCFLLLGLFVLFSMMSVCTI